jgi:hypothetical protein
MGKTRRERRYLKKNGCLLPTNNEKIVLTSRQLENIKDFADKIAHFAFVL